jgi:zinc transport system ATP-binding protein
MAPLIACRDAAFGYNGGTAVSGLTFEVWAGDYLCVAGENGSGKSTLLKGLLGLLPIQKGELLFGESLTPREIGYLPQYKAPQKDFPASVFEVVLSGRQGRRGILPFYTKEDKQAAAEHLSRLGIADLRNRCYRELSGGQQQRTLLARAFCAARRLLVLDEPAAGLDPGASAELYRIINGLIQTARVGVIMVSHDLKTAVSAANRILHLQGKQVFWGSPAEYAQSAPGKAFLSHVQ